MKGEDDRERRYLAQSMGEESQDHTGSGQKSPSRGRGLEREDMAAMTTTPDQQVKHFVERSGLGPLKGPEDFDAAFELLREERVRRGIRPLCPNHCCRATALVIGADLDQVLLNDGRAINLVLRQN